MMKLPRSSLDNYERVDKCFEADVLNDVHVGYKHVK